MIVKPANCWSRRQMERFLVEGSFPRPSSKVTGDIIHQVDREIDGQPTSVVVFERGKYGTEVAYGICVAQWISEDRVLLETLVPSVPCAEGRCRELAIDYANRISDERITQLLD